VQLFSRKEDVDRINKERLAMLPGQCYTYHCLDDVWINKDHEHLQGKKRRNGDGSLEALVSNISVNSFNFSHGDIG
jgi:hypothetical protein